MQLTTFLLAFAAAVAAVSPAGADAAGLVVLQKRLDVTQRTACLLSSRANATDPSSGGQQGATTSTTTTTTSAAAKTSASPKPSPTPPPVSSSFSGRCINRMNYYRSRHGRAPFSFSASLQSRAQSWANSCVWSHNSVGQNMWSGTEQDCIAAVDAWYAEIRQLSPGRTYAIASIWQTAGHLTQLLDRNTRYAGCGVGCKTVCDFDPAGNVIGQTFAL
ncbi:hypothetical protein HK105_201576 [Polyrhizophydium stewartii]|uniref:SCP domain-containing protein n=1 Tax=Polyrhizophydium stewartii TaxID=2732419 RepID=A0ABR4NGT1_9FUNG|nr:hypothetical protein HK105_008058 [Polyrhizophydium stewartii]